MIMLGLLLLILGVLFEIGLFSTLGGLLLVVGVILYAMGSIGRPVGPRRHYW